MHFTVCSSRLQGEKEKKLQLHAIGIYIYTHTHTSAYDSDFYKRSYSKTTDKIVGIWE